MKNYQGVTTKKSPNYKKTSQKFPLKYFTDLYKLRWYHLLPPIRVSASLCHISHKQHLKRHLSKPLMTLEMHSQRSNGVRWLIACCISLNSDRGIPSFLETVGTPRQQPRKRAAAGKGISLLTMGEFLE